MHQQLRVVITIFYLIFYYRDSTIVSLADTGTSILAGVTIFSILGNLAYETGKPLPEVVKSGTGLAFISYPEAISKFDAVPQVMSGHNVFQSMTSPY